LFRGSLELSFCALSEFRETDPNVPVFRLPVRVAGKPDFSLVVLDLPDQLIQAQAGTVHSQMQDALSEVGLAREEKDGHDRLREYAGPMHPSAEKQPVPGPGMIPKVHDREASLDTFAQEQICVLTGDIVRSSSYSDAQLQSLMAALHACCKTIRTWSEPMTPEMERFRGDGWQFVVGNPHHALRAGLLLRASVRALDAKADTRIGFGTGPGTVERALGSSSGPAFERSGTLLEQIKGPDRWAFHIDRLDSSIAAVVEGLFIACEAVSSTWTRRQAEVFGRVALPDEPTLAEVADEMQVKPQTVQDHFAKAGGRALLKVIHLFEQGQGPVQKQPK
jgi:hypothetical protein